MEIPRRKRRFPVCWPLQYRRADQTNWQKGRTVNMSLTGVLFEGAEPLSKDQPVELTIVFHSGNQSLRASTTINAGGLVVRSEPNVPARIAVKFTDDR